MAALDVGDLGAVGIFIILVLQAVFRFISEQRFRNGTGKSERHLLRELHEWHKPDSAGRQTWKLGALASTLDALSANVATLAKQVDKLARKIDGCPNNRRED